ncbi:hypothetical protein GCM10027084_05360 [Pseudoxanthomonas sangjuensis]
MTSRQSKKSKAGVPDWVTSHFESALEAEQSLIRAISISRSGISLVTRMPRLNKAVARVQGKTGPDPERQKAIEEDAALAESEIKNDFPVLHSLATVGLWSWLEHLVKGIAIEWVKHNPSLLSGQPFNRLRVKLSDYVPLTKAEQSAYIIELLEQETSSSLKRGVNRFEALLDPFGLSGAVPSKTSDSIFELQQIRNAIAHQNGRCDRKLKASCPWLKLKIGSPISISHRQLSNYSAACMDYGLLLLYRIGDHHGVNLRDDSAAGT